MTLTELNDRLTPIGLHLNIDTYTTGTPYEAWFSYWNAERQKWGVLHVLGRFITQRRAIDAALNFLRINKTHY